VECAFRKILVCGDQRLKSRTADKPKQDFFGTLSGDVIVSRYKVLCREVWFMRSFSNRILVLLLLGLVLPFGLRCLNAQTGEKEKSPRPKSKSVTRAAESDTGGLLGLMDADQDGFVTRDEWQRIFASHDKNGDDRLSREEIESIPVQGSDEGAPDPNQGRLAAFDRLDVNRNNRIDSEEWPGNSKDFGYLDANQDGTLSREEFLSRNGRFWNELFENLDLDGNGIIIRSEWLDSVETFDRLDRDRNGVIEPREYYNPR